MTLPIYQNWPIHSVWKDKGNSFQEKSAPIAQWSIFTIFIRKIPRLRQRKLKQMEPILNFQVPAEGLELVILLHTQYITLVLHNSLMHHDSQKNIVIIIFIYFFQ